MWWGRGGSGGGASWACGSGEGEVGGRWAGRTRSPSVLVGGTSRSGMVEEDGALPARMWEHDEHLMMGGEREGGTMGIGTTGWRYGSMRWKPRSDRAPERAVTDLVGWKMGSAEVVVASWRQK